MLLDSGMETTFCAGDDQHKEDWRVVKGNKTVVFSQGQHKTQCFDNKLANIYSINTVLVWSRFGWYDNAISLCLLTMALLKRNIYLKFNYLTLVFRLK